MHRRHHHGYARRHGGCWGFGPGFAWASATAGDGPRGSALYFSTSSGDDDGSAGLTWKWQYRASTSLACAQPDCTDAPIDILKTEFCNLDGP